MKHEPHDGVGHAQVVRHATGDATNHSSLGTPVCAAYRRWLLALAGLGPRRCPV